MTEFEVSLKTDPNNFDGIITSLTYFSLAFLAQKENKEFNVIIQEILSILNIKGLEYGTFYNRTNKIAIITRIYEKIYRAVNIVRCDLKIRSKEKLIDTTRDLIGYCFLYLSN